MGRSTRTSPPSCQVCCRRTTVVARPSYFVARTADPAIPTDVLVDWDRHRRRLDAAAGLPAPDRGRRAVGFAGTVAPPSTHFPWAQLVRLDEPLRARGDPRHAGATADRVGGTPLELRVFPTDAPDRCVTGQFAHPTLAHLSYDSRAAEASCAAACGRRSR